MLRAVVQKLLMLIPVLLIVSFGTFLLLELALLNVFKLVLPELPRPKLSLFLKPLLELLFVASLLVRVAQLLLLRLSLRRRHSARDFIALKPEAGGHTHTRTQTKKR